MSLRRASVRPDLVAVAALAVASHAAALRGGFIWLDHAHLEGGLALVEPGSLWASFTRGFAGTGYYRPLVTISLSLDAVLSHTPAWFRVVTLGWHALAAVMVSVAARWLRLSARAALVAGLVFAVHPLTSLVASATAFRSEAMCLVFLLGLLVAHEARRPMWAGLALLLGALTKETAWLLGPLLIGALELSRRSTPEAPGHAWPRRTLVAEALAFAGATALRLLWVPPFRARFPELSLGDALGTRLAAFTKSLLAAGIPADRSICDAFPVTGLASASALAGGLALAGIGYLAFRRRGLWLLLALALLPSLQLVPVMRWWSPHYLYVPLAFAAMLLGRASERWQRGRLLGLALAGAACFALSFVESGRYASDERLFRPEVEREPACREGEFYLAEAARVAGRWQEAGARYAHASAPAPGYLAYVDEGAALVNLGAMLMVVGRLDAAQTAFTHALARPLDPTEVRGVRQNLALLSRLRGGAPVSLAENAGPARAQPRNVW